MLPAGRSCGGLASVRAGSAGPRSLVAKRGSARIRAAAATPATATRASAARMAIPGPGNTAAAKASGARATLSIRPSMTSERQSTRTPAGQRGYRRTTATRIASSKRPGRTTPINAAPPFPAASASTFGRSSGVNSRPQPYALRAWARRSRSPAATSTPGSPPASGQEVVAKWRAANSASATMTAPEPAASTHRPLRERPSRQSAPTSRRYLPSRTIGASGTAIAARGSRWRRSPGGSGVGAAFMALSLRGHAPISEVA
jgi:hypothetical protein